MKKIYFRILAICLSLVLTFSILYKDSIQADALEWVGVAVGYDTAFKFLLGLLGVSVGLGVANEVDWGQLRQDCTQVMIDQGASQVEASQWWADVIHGTLNTASDCWTSFKDWVSSLFSTSSNGLSVSEAIASVNASIDTSPLSSSILNFKYDKAFHYMNGSVQYFYFINGGSVSVIDNSNIFNVSGSGITSYCVILKEPGRQIVGSLKNTSSFNLSNLAAVYMFFYNITFPQPNNYLSSWNLGSTSSSVPLESLYPNIGDIALNPENADTLSTDVIPLPWENIGASDTAIENIIDDAISRVNDGTMSLENYWEYVQNITNTYAYSIENNYLLPNENGEDKKADDKVKENAENGAFVLYGLEKVFPFCIPFDIYAFITLLKADPVAPVIEYPIYNPVTQENEIIIIDFSEWESVVIIFRYIFDFLLIIGLLLLARPLVGAGGDS